MRLINVHTEKLETFYDSATPPYAILSHTWEQDEVLYHDITSGNLQYRSKLGYRKIDYAIKQAIQEAYDYVWVDSRTIDKSSSAELSEAINSMFKWYKDAGVCYAYLCDVPATFGVIKDLPFARHIRLEEAEDFRTNPFTNSRWFTRGWTLQELLAPEYVKFYGSAFNYLGSNNSLCNRLSAITGVDLFAIKSHSSYLLQGVSVAKRMSWAADRQTTRIEDKAYCLLGIFGVNMPLLYGEGERSFIRLQEEIIRTSDDQSIFAWEGKGEAGASLLASSPSAFKQSRNVTVWDGLEVKDDAYAMTNKGLQITLPLVKTYQDGIAAVLCCRYEDDLNKAIALRLSHEKRDGSYRLIQPRTTVVGFETAEQAPKTPVTIATSGGNLHSYYDTRNNAYQVRLRNTMGVSIERHDCFPSLHWNPKTKSFLIPKVAENRKAAIKLSCSLIPMWIVFGYFINDYGIEIVPQHTSLTPETIVRRARTGLDVRLKKKAVFEDGEWDIKVVATVTQTIDLGFGQSALIIDIAGSRTSEL